MSILAFLGLLLVAAWLATAAGLNAWALAYRAPDGERIAVTTADDWTLHVYRYPPQGVALDRPPVILGHGFMMNRWCWSLSEAGSLPLALSALGFDVFVAEYRGSGASHGPRGWDDRRPGGRDGWGFDDHVQLDLPAIIGAVREVTGAERVHWVGHSMGGMAGYAYALSTGGHDLASLVTMGSPTRFSHVRALFGPTGPLATRGLTRMHRLPMRFWMRWVTPATVLAPELSMRTSGPAKHLTAAERVTLMTEAFEDTSPALAGFFLDHWLEDRSLIPGGQGALSFADLTVPTLVLGGAQDVLAPPAAISVPYRETDSGVVAYRLFGDPSLPADEAGPGLGHADLISGQAAMTHVLPFLADWLRAEHPLTLPGLCLSSAPLPAKAV